MRREHSIRQSVAISVALLSALFLLPLVVIAPFQTELFGEEDAVHETEGEPFVSGDMDGKTVLKVLQGDQVEEMDLGTYLVGVVRAEMPASFELEALKAQAVAARTYTLYKIQTGGNHGDTADICTDSTCCQAYISEEKARNNWGEQADEYEQKIEQAVTATDGQAILYGGVPILAVFHSSSAGVTRPAGEVWQNDLPYLQAVESPEPGETIPNYYSRVEFTAEEFRKAFTAAYPEADLSGDISGWLKDAVVDSAGSVPRDYLMQGTKVMVEGEIVTGNYEDKDTGKKIYTTEVYANRIEFAGAKMVDRPPFPEDAEGFLEIPEGMEEEMPFR